MSAFALQQLPDRFQGGPKSEVFTRYVTAKYGKYGFRRYKSIEFNPEFPVKEERFGRGVETGDHYRWVEHVSNGLRKTGDSGDLIRLDHTEWYIDNFQDETVHGEVWQLPARDGEALYVPAVSDPCNPDCSCIDFRSVTPDKEDAARWADSMAEQWADREREYRAREDQKNRLEEIAEEIKREYTDFRRIVRELRASCDQVQGIAVVRELVKDRWAETKAAIQALRRERERVEQYGIEY